MNANRVELVAGISNREFLELHAQPGRVGLVGGFTLINQMIQRAERHVDEDEQPSLWSHAFLCEGRRADGHHWVIESDLEIHRRHVRLGVQENRIVKFHDEQAYASLAVLDFGLAQDRVSALIGAGLEMVANRYRYSLRELLGTLAGLRKPERRGAENPLAREKSCFCSAFVQHVFRQVGVDLAPGLDVKHTTPEDISRSPVPHVTYLLRRGQKMPMIRRKIRVAVRKAARRL